MKQKMKIRDVWNVPCDNGWMIHCWNVNVLAAATHGTQTRRIPIKNIDQKTL